jgi:WD40 repeat protein
MRSRAALATAPVLLALAWVPAAYSAAGPPLLRDSHGDPVPLGALARLGTVRFRWSMFATLHDNAHQRVTFLLSPDGRLVAGVSLTGQVPLRCSVTSRTIHWLGDGVSRQIPAAFSPDSRLLATLGLDRRARVWDVQTGKCLARFLISQAPPATRPRVRFWFAAATFLPHGRHLAVWENDGNLSIWDLRLCRQVRRVRLLGGWVNEAAFSPDGQLLVQRIDSAHLRIYQLLTGKSWRLSVPFSSTEHWTWTWARDSRQLAVAETSLGKCIVVLDVRSGKELARLAHAGSLSLEYALVFSPSGRFLAAPHKNGAVIHDLKGGPRRYLSGSEKQPLTHLLFRDEQHLLARATSTPWSSVISTWDLRTGRSLPRPAAHEDFISALAFDASGRSLVTAGYDDTLRQWDVPAGKLRRTLQPGKGEVLGLVALAADGRTVICAGTTLRGDASVRAIDLASGKLRWRRSMNEYPGFDPRSGRRVLALSARRPVLVTGPDTPDSADSVHLLDALTGRTFSTIPWKDALMGRKALSPDGKLLALIRRASKEGEVVLFDTQTRQLVQSFKGVAGEVQRGTDRHSDVPEPFTFTPDGRELLLVDCKELHLWELASGRRLLRQRLPEDFQATGVRATQAGRILVMGKRETVFCPPEYPGNAYITDLGAAIWDVEAGTFVKVLPPGTNAELLAISPDGKLLAAVDLCDAVLLSRVPPSALGSARMSRQQLDKLWEDLALAAGEKVWRARQRLAAAPEQAIAWLRQNLRPARPTALGKWLADLDDDEFTNREAASRALAALLAKRDRQTQFALRRLLKSKPSLEVRWRVRRLLGAARDDFPLTGAELRLVRAVAVLEQIGTPAAVTLLRRLAGGASEALLTVEARRSLERLVPSTKAVRRAQP